MFSRIQARGYRSLKSIDQRVGRMQALVGPNASGKTTFLDVIGFMSELVRHRGDVRETVLARSGSFDKLVWQGVTSSQLAGMLSAKLLLIASLAFAACVGCKDNGPAFAQPTTERKASAMTTEVSIKLGEMGPSLAKRYPDKVRVVHQPAGLDFYKMSWERPRGTVRIDHGNRSFVVEDVLGVSSAQDLEEFKAEGLYEYDVSSGMSVPSPGLIPHDEARMKIHAILRRIMEAGWKNTVDIGDPRTRGKERLAYALSTNNYTGLDASYVPTFEEWMRIPSRTPWYFYADNVYMTIIFTREPTLTDPTKPGAYLLSFNIKTVTEHFRAFAGPDNRLRWKEVVPAAIAEAKAERPKRETELRAKGIKIDDSYQDPPVPAFK